MTLPGNLVFIGGIIRPDSSGAWSIQNDSTHAPENLHSVEREFQAGYGGWVLKLTFSTTLYKCNSIQITPDDDMTALGIRVGCNMGNGNTLIVLRRDNLVIDPATVFLGNIWITAFGYSEVA